MITLAVGILLAVYVAKCWQKMSEGKITFCIVTAIVCGIFALLIPVEGCSTALKSETVLLPLKVEEEPGKVYYVQEDDRNGNYLYAYDNSEKYGLSGGAYEEKKIYGYPVKIYESADCKTPILKVFVTKPKSIWYTFAVASTSYEYVFYIPVGTTKVVE